MNDPQEKYVSGCGLQLLTQRKRLTDGWSLSPASRHGNVNEIIGTLARQVQPRTAVKKLQTLL